MASGRGDQGQSVEGGKGRRETGKREQTTRGWKGRGGDKQRGAGRGRKRRCRMSVSSSTLMTHAALTRAWGTQVPLGR